MNARDSRNLDAYLTREPCETESDLYCVRCDLPSAECAEPDEHAASWETWAEKRRSELADYLYDRD